MAKTKTEQPKGYVVELPGDIEVEVVTGAFDKERELLIRL